MNIWARWLADCPATLQRLIARTHRVSLPRSATPAVRVERLRRALCGASATRAVYFALPRDCRAALQLLRSTPRGFTAPQLAAHLGPVRPLAELRAEPRPRSRAERLVLAGLLFHRPGTPYHPERYILPPELRRWLPTPLCASEAEDAPDPACPEPAPPAATAATIVLLAAAEAPLALCSSGVPRAATLRTLAARLAPTPPDQAAALLGWLVPLLLALRLLARQGASALPTATTAAFLRRAPAERAWILQAAWLASPRPERWLALPARARAQIDWPALRRRLLAWSAALPAGRLLDCATLYAPLAAALGPLSAGAAHATRASRRAPWGATRSAFVWQCALTGPLAWLGLVALAPPSAASGARCYRTSRAAAPLEPPDTPPTADERPRQLWHLLDPGLLVIAAADLDADVLALVSFARWESASDAGATYRIDMQTLARASAVGHARSTLRALIERRSGPLPTAWEALLAAPTPAVRIVHAAIAIADNAQILDRAARRRSVRRYLADHLAPGVALVEPGAAPGLGRALARAAIAVTVAGDPRVAPPAELTPSECALLLAACELYRASGPATGQALELLAERLRAQLPATRAANAPPDNGEQAEPNVALVALPAEPPLDPVAELRAAIAGRRAVGIAYQSAQASAPTPRTVRPLRLELAGEHWYLAAFCLVKQQELTFRVDRIHAMQTLDASPRSTASLRPKRTKQGADGRRGSLALPAHTSVGSGGAWLEP